MTKALQATLSIAVAVVIILSGVSFLAGWFFSSTWFVWSLLPANSSLEYVVDSNQPLIVSTLAMFDQNYNNNFSRLLAKTTKIGTAHTKQGAVLVLVPKISQQLVLPAMLNADGWHIERQGLAIRAEKNAVDLPSFKQSLMAAASKMLMSKLPVAPIAVLTARSGMGGNSNGSVAVIANQYADGIRFVANTSINGLAVDKAVDIMPINALDAMNIAVPGSVISNLPIALRDSWNDYLREKMGFKLTHPDILGELAIFKRITIVVNDSNVTVGVQNDSSSFSNLAFKWLADEERYSRPIKRVFRLPDGSIGYEKVPGQVSTVLGLAQEGCRAPISGKTTYWLCTNGDSIILSNSEQLARTTKVSTGNNQWSILINPKLLVESSTKTGNCPWCSFKNLSIFGVDQKVVGDLWLEDTK